MVLPSSFLRLFSLPGFRLRDSEHRHTSRVRHAMLSLLQVHGGHGVQRVAQRVRFAGDLEALWYLRQDMMCAISEIDGEAAARRQLRPINSMFKGRLPETMGPRRHQRFNM
ncbi:hypothetical protein [Variovorax sp. dw_954]|jgi:hypothetical protein|uniref:hypothetical protein n=2 Tax=unclassified Variovorax TaxID=663243 RepID=UPI001BD435C7|nr:hypothetical protein [Variovorax sp. dw_954]